MTVRESLVAHPAAERTAPPPGRQPGAPDTVTRPPDGRRALRMLHGTCGWSGHADTLLLNGRAPGLRRLFGRLAAVFYAGAGLWAWPCSRFPRRDRIARRWRPCTPPRWSSGSRCGWRHGSDGPGRPAWRSCRPRSPSSPCVTRSEGRASSSTASSSWSPSCGSAWPIRRARRPPWRRSPPRPTSCRCPAARQPRAPGCRRPRSPSRSACWWGKGSRGG